MLHRDSVIWWIGLVGGIVTAMAAQADLFPASWRAWITMLATILAAASGKLATSPLPGAKDLEGQKVDLHKIGSLLLVLALLPAASNCALKGSARHQTVVAVVTIGDALIAATDFEREHWRELGIEEPTHRAYQGAMVRALTTAKAVDQTILAWPADAAMPGTLRPLVLQLKADLDAGLSLLPPSSLKDAITTKLAAVWSLVGLVLGA